MPNFQRGVMDDYTWSLGIATTADVDVDLPHPDNLVAAHWHIVVRAQNCEEQ
jgi:hypothetical protein